MPQTSRAWALPNERVTMPAPFVFVVGKGRSGTTLVRAMLTAHPEMAIPPETHFIVRMSKRPGVVREGRVEIGVLVDRLQDHHGFAKMGLEPEVVRQQLELSEPPSYAGAIRLIFGMYAASKGKSRYGDKSPGHVMHIPALAELFPEARFIHVIRDGRDVLLSNLETRFGPADVAEGALVWRRVVAEGRRAGVELGADRYSEIKYEDLLDDPEGQVRRLADFSSLDFHPDMLRYFKRGSEIVGSAWHHRNLNLPPTKGMRDWRIEMPGHHVFAFEVLAGDQLEAFGYERSAERASLSGWLELGNSWLAFQARRTRNFTKQVRRPKKQKPLR
jgi:hypothetical protein